MIITKFWRKNHPKIKARQKKIGKNVKFGKNVMITGIKDELLRHLVIGDNCVFHDNVRIIVSPNCMIGNNCVFHNNVSVVGTANFIMGNNNWVGQDAYLDTKGKLTIGNGNTIGIKTMIWSHMIRPENTYKGFFPNPSYYIDYKAHTVIGNFCWTNPGSQISPGVVLADGTIVLNNAVVTKSTKKSGTYGGIPAKEITIRKQNK